MQNLSQTLFTLLFPYITQHQSLFFSKLKKHFVASKLKNIRKQQPSYQYSSIGNTSSMDTSNYMSIKPLQNSYSSIKIINNSGFNYNEENILLHELDDEEKNVYQKSDYIEKYFNLTKKQVIGIESLPISDYALKNIKEYNEAGMQKVEECKYTQYFSQAIAQRKNWRGKVIDQMKFSKDIIDQPITNLEGSHHETAIKMFQSLLEFDKVQLQGPRCVMTANHLNFLCKLPEQLIQQGYFQILKQLKGHRFTTYIKLLAAAAVVVKPPLRLHIPLLNYCITHLSQCPRYYTYIFYLLVKNFNRPRTYGISAFECDLIMHLRKIPIIVDFPTQKMFFVECTTSVQDTIEEIISYFELNKDEKYLINYKHGYLETGNLLDGLFHLEGKKDKDGKYNVKDTYNKFGGYKVLLVLKNSMNYFKESTGINLLYAYESKKFLGGIYKFKRKQIIDLACLKYYSQNDGLDLIDLSLYIPLNFILNYGTQYFLNRMSKKLQSITCTKKQSRKQFLRLLRKKDGFLSHIFQGMFYITDMQQFISKVVLFMSPGSLIIIGSFDPPVNKKIRFNQIKEWGKSRSQICFRYKTGKGYKVAHVECQNQGLVNQIFEDYLVSVEEYYKGRKRDEVEKEEEGKKEGDTVK